MQTVTMEQAYKMRNAMRESVNRKGKPGEVVVTVKMAEGAFNLIDYLLERIEKGELAAVQPEQAPQYTQPAMLEDAAGTPLFSVEG